MVFFHLRHVATASRHELDKTLYSLSLLVAFGLLKNHFNHPFRFHQFWWIGSIAFNHTFIRDGDKDFEPSIAEFRLNLSKYLFRSQRFLCIV